MWGGMRWGRVGWSGGSGYRYLKRKWVFRKEHITQIHISFYLANQTHAWKQARAQARGRICGGACQYFSSSQEAILAVRLSELLSLFLQVGAASDSYNLLCCSQLQFSCISWVSRSRRGLQLCALVVNTMQFAACIRRCTHVHSEADKLSLSVCDPQGQQPTAAKSLCLSL